jgi:hypothetical protein
VRGLRRRGWRQTPPLMKRKNEIVNTHARTSTHTHTVKFFQTNLHHSKAAMATSCQQLAEKEADVALIQEAWIYRGQIRGLTNTG